MRRKSAKKAAPKKAAKKKGVPKKNAGARAVPAPHTSRLTPHVIYGIGVDLLRQERMDKVWKRHGERLPQKILCEAELREFAQSKRPARYLAMAFAAKEAFVKALGRGLSYPLDAFTVAVGDRPAILAGGNGWTAADVQAPADYRAALVFAAS